MPDTYQYSLADNGSLLCTRSQPAHEQTRGLFIDDRADGYGATGITGDWTLPANAINGFGFFEYYRGDTETYHRVLIPGILTAIDADRTIEDPPALDVRHAAWPGMDRREIELQILARRQRAIEDALRRAVRGKPARKESGYAASRRPAGGPKWRPRLKISTVPWRPRSPKRWKLNLDQDSGCNRFSRNKGWAGKRP